MVRVVPVSSPSQEGFDCFVLVCENLEWDNPTWEFLKEPIKAAAKVDKAVGMDTLLFPCKETSMVYSPTGPVNRDYDDVRCYGEAASKGIKRALKAGSESPLLVTIPGKTFPNSWSVSLLGALNELYLPFELRELAFPKKQQKVKQLGVMVLDQSQNLDFVTAIDSGRSVYRDIGGSDPERMAAPRVEEYITKLFGDSSPVKVSVVKDVKEFEAKYPLYEAVNRCSRAVERHAGRVINLEYVGEGEITKTIFLVGKGQVWRSSCGWILSEGYVADEIITSAAGTRVRVGNTDAEGRMAMADSLHYMKEKALKEKVPAHIVTIATLTGHAILAMGPYSHGIDSVHPIRYSHFDIAGSSGGFPYVPTGAPLVAMATHFLKGHC
ncbi:putative aminopeptidase W07G4.4 [Acropora cervicornis]|uniref:Aminopeptidase W07G4.4 n=1 Tax=Acropora cervicornis TaxID=6130 RepID=A0AAD9VFW3_ACRCE|nr:putative aminopeptidase W07G4.4 [Acropora cervicornis]